MKLRQEIPKSEPHSVEAPDLTETQFLHCTDFKKQGEIKEGYSEPRKHQSTLLDFCLVGLWGPGYTT